MFPLGNGEPELPVAILPTGAHLTPIGQQNQVVAPAIDIDHTVVHHDDVASIQPISIVQVCQLSAQVHA